MRSNPLKRPGMATVVVAALVCAPGSARAYRPFDTTDADVLSDGVAELELAPLGFLHEGSDDFAVLPALVLNYGLSQRVELIVEGQYQEPLRSSVERRSRITDTGFAVKWLAREGTLQGRTGPSVATELGLLLPTWHDEPGVGAVWLFGVSYEGNAGTIHLNVEPSYTRAHNAGLFEGLILEGPGDWPARPVLELFAEQERGGDSVISGLAGAIMPLSDAAAIDCAVRVAREGDVRVTELRMGLVWEVALVTE